MRREPHLKCLHAFYTEIQHPNRSLQEWGNAQQLIGCILHNMDLLLIACSCQCCHLMSPALNLYVHALKCSQQMWKAPSQARSLLLPIEIKWRRQWVRFSVISPEKCSLEGITPELEVRERVALHNLCTTWILVSCGGWNGLHHKLEQSQWNL